MTPDPEFLFLSGKHREALAGLVYAIVDRKGFLVLTGDAGTGKTTLLAKTLSTLPISRIRSSVILNPLLTAAEFLEMALMDFGIKEVPASKAQRLARLREYLEQGHQNGQISALIIDEAHRLSPEVLEEIRLLGNFEHPDEKLLQILLLGQPELGDILNRNDMRQLKQRIAVRFSIDPLSALDVERYISHRWGKAGAGTPPPFAPEALQAIGRWSGGIPRVINAICENSLMLAFAEGSRLVSTQHVRETCAELDLLLHSDLTNTLQGVNGTRNGAKPIPLPEVPPEPVPMAPVHLPTLERYREPASPRSFWVRWTGKFGVSHS